MNDDEQRGRNADAGDDQDKDLRGPGRILKATAVLPGFFTMCNGLFGFGAIHFATKQSLGSGEMVYFTTSAWLIFAAMVCDMLDGRLARMTRRSSDFGGQLDSLCDVISFGVAPATLMLRCVITAMRQVEGMKFAIALERAVWSVAAVYVACVVLRLARFNVESEPDKESHLDFKGLPSPGAAAALASLVLLLGHLGDDAQGGWFGGSWIFATGQWVTKFELLVAASIALPAAAMLTAVLMVSRIQYAHVVNQYTKGRRSFGYLVGLVVAILASMIEPFVVMAVVAVGYTLSGPVLAIKRKIAGR